MSMSKVVNDNNRIFVLLSLYLNDHSKIITKEMIDNVKNENISEELAFKLLLSSIFQLDIHHNLDDKRLYYEYIDKIIKKLDPSEYQNNPYYKNIKWMNKTIGNCQLHYSTYQEYEGFVYDDIDLYPNGKQIPRVGFFNKKYRYPAVYEDGQLWMSITPNEINTMKNDIDRAFGNVLTYGLGLGYFQYMVSNKENVSKVTIIEKNKDIIKLFVEYILPQFPNKDKIKIICMDAFEYAANNVKDIFYDFIYADLWHDVSDGIEMYQRFKELEKNSPKSVYRYWIEKSIKNFYLI